MPPPPAEIPAGYNHTIPAIKSSPPPPSPPRESAKARTASRTPSLASLLKTETKNEGDTNTTATEASLTEPFTEEKLREAWNEYAEQRKKFQAEYQMLSQPYKLEGNLIIVDLLSPVHETMLNAIKSELTGYLREKLRNNTIQVTGHVQSDDAKKVIYTNREKFDFLAEKNPMLRELKDRLGLDTEF